VTTKTTAKNTIVLINGYHFSTDTTAFQTSANVNPIDVTGFEDGCKNFIPGILSASMICTMLWDADTNSVHQALKAMPNGVATLIPEGWVLGNTTISLPFTQSNYNPQGTPVTALRVGNLSFVNYGTTSLGIEFGWALQHGTITNTLTGTGLDDPTDGAVTKACVGTLHVWTPPAADTYVVKIQHSDTLGSGYADLITFVANGSTRTVERQVIASGLINKYRRVVATRTGSAGNSFGFSVHFWHG
jgi:hypothetical protein